MNFSETMTATTRYLRLQNDVKVKQVAYMPNFKLPKRTQEKENGRTRTIPAMGN